MIIAIDGYEANVPQRVGISRYALELIRSMHQINRASDIRVYLPQEPRSEFPPENPQWTYKVITPKKFWTFIGLPVSLTLDTPKANVIFSPTHYAPRWVSTPRVISIMDLSYIQYPEMFRKNDLHKLIHWTKYSAGKAHAILTISEFSRRAIIDEYQVDEKRVLVTYPGLSMPTTNSSKPDSNIQSKYAIGGDYILSVGTLQPRKNFTKLIEAFSTIHKKYPDVKLVIVGKKGWLYDEILRAPSHYRIENEVKFLDFVPDSDLPSLYREAACFVLASLYEGFGLPVLEAMSYGCPVVVSNASSLPEVAGEAGIYIDPTNVEDIANGIEKGLDSRSSTAGKKRITIGKDRAKEFTWQKAARKTLDILEKVGKGEL